MGCAMAASPCSSDEHTLNRLPWPLLTADDLDALLTEPMARGDGGETVGSEIFVGVGGGIQGRWS